MDTELDNLAPKANREEGSEQDMDESDGVSSESSEEDGAFPEPSEPSAREEEPLLDERIGLGGQRQQPQRGGIGSTRSLGGIGSTGGAGIGSNGAGLGAASGSTRQPKSFLTPLASQSPGTSSPKPATVLSAEERRHFAKLETAGGRGFKLLSKMGWNTGTGLGASNEGRVNPVDQVQRPKGMGIGHSGFKEKSKQSVVEARRSDFYPSSASRA